MSCNPDYTQEELRIQLRIKEEVRKDLLATMQEYLPTMKSNYRLDFRNYERICKQLDYNGEEIRELQAKLKQ